MAKYTDRIVEEYTAGNINSYMAERLAKASEFGMTPELVEQAVEDTMSASKHDIDSDDKYSLRFFVLNIADDMLDDTFSKKISCDEKEELCSYIVNNMGDERYALDNLTDFRILMHNWLCDKHVKKAYPNTMGKEDREIIYDTSKWVDTARTVYDIIKREGLTHDTSINLATVGWEAEERFKFTNWLKYYESGNTEKLI